MARPSLGSTTDEPFWQNLVYARLVAMPEGADLACGSHLVAALTFGLQVLRLRDASGREPGGAHVAAGLEAFARSDLDGMAQDLDRADATLARFASARRNGDVAALRIRTAIPLVRDVVRQHPGTFGGAER